MRPERGSLLISSAALTDPHFARTLVLVLDADEGGALGIVLNRPSDTAVGAVLPAWSDLTSAPQVLFAGGPVQGDSALAVAALTRPEQVPDSWQSLGPTAGSALGLIDLDASPDTYLGRISALRVYAGYAGWGAGQLEHEIEEGSWHVAGSQLGDLFHDSPGTLWREVLRRQPGQVAMLTTLPDDARLN